MSKTLKELLEENQIEVRPSSGGRYVAHCPLHEGDTTASFTIYPEDNYYCFGCNAWGDPVKFLCEYKGWTKKEAEEYVGIEAEYKKADKAKVIKIQNVSQTWGFLRRVSTIYHANLLRTPGAWNYLISRGLTDYTIYDHQIGYSDGRTLNLQFAHDWVLAKEAGLITTNGYELMSHRITIPNYIDAHHVDFIMGRTVTNDKVKYLGTRLPKPIYGFARNAKSPILFLAEGQFDWLILTQWGYPAIVLSGSHLPAYHRMLLKDKWVVIVPDNDDVGLKTAKSLLSVLPTAQILDYSRLGVKDIGELGPMEDGEKLFSEIVRENLWENTRILKEVWKRFLPNSVTIDQSGLTWRLQD